MVADQIILWRIRPRTNPGYTAGDAVAKLGTGATCGSYKKDGEPSLNRFVPDHGVSFVDSLRSVLTLDQLVADPGYTAAFARAKQEKPGLKTLARDDGLIKTMCAAAGDAIDLLEQKKGPLQKPTFVVQKDMVLTDGNMGELLLTFESISSPTASVLKDRCTSWVGDLIACNSNDGDMSVIGGWRALGKRSLITRLGLQINSKLSH